jgi:hypothetical protein
VVARPGLRNGRASRRGGAVGTIFSQAPECKRITGIDPTASDAVIEAHADIVARFVLGPDR